MRYTHLTRANVDVSSLAIGTWAIGGAGYGEVNDQDSIDAIRTALENGVNLVDTAPAYGNGHAERIVGEAIKTFDRSKLFISTKGCIGATTLRYKKLQEPGFVRDSSYENVLYECEQSLRRLNTDYIDFYFIHWPAYEPDFEDTAKAFEQLKKEGKIRFVGVSNFSKEQIEEMSKYIQIDVIQPPYSMVDLRDEELLKWTHEQGIDSFTYGSLGAGILSGKYREVPQFGPRDPRNFFYPYFKEPSFSKVMKLLKVMDEISEEERKPLIDIALNWTTQKDYVSVSLCGVRNSRQAKADCDAFEWKLSEEEIKKIDQAIDTYIDFNR